MNYWIQFTKTLKGDKGIWAFVGLLAVISFLPVFSASSNLAYKDAGNGNTFSYFAKHFIHIFIGFLVIYQVQKIPYHYYRALSKYVLYISWFLLFYTLAKGTTSEGVNAARWIRLPYVGVTFQTSTFAFLILMVYIARYLAKIENIKVTFSSSLKELWIPVGITIMLILPANFSTAFIISLMVLMLVSVTSYPITHILKAVGLGILAMLMFLLIARTFPNPLTTRVKTWESRFERFFIKEAQDADNMYQTEKAKTAIATGGTTGLGPGKSVQRNFLPQSSSDFIYAIIVEEYGLVGGLGVILLYLLLFFRFIVAIHKSNNFFGKLLVIGLGFPIVFQAFINMGVAVNLLPVTGQPLPLISSGGTSIWVTCIAIGIILNVTKKDEEIAQEISEEKKRSDALQKLINKQLEEDEKELSNGITT
ncbi:MAG: FtsW/RodA/SpoVE family cell cycle protein [Flavobacterium sp.]